ncbi:NOD3 protein [Pelomyxa schiedti]|nr:NOD3 protein [Pelomyxa schiedti]
MMGSTIQNKITDNKIGSEGATSIARALESNKSLVSLDLWANEIGYHGATSIARALKTNKSLVSLDIALNEIWDIWGEAAARALELNKSLMYLSLFGNKIGSRGATTIAGALELNKSLVSLNLSLNHIGDPGATSIARALESNKSLLYLFLGHNKIRGEGATSIARALKSNKSLVSLEISRGPENTLSDALFEIPIEIFDSQNRPPRTHPNAMAVATGKEYFDCNFTKSPTSSAQTRSTMPETPVEEIPQHNQQPFPDSSMTSAPVENTQTAPTSLHSPNLSLPFAQRSSAASKLGTPSQSPETLTTEIPPSLPGKPPTIAPKPETILIPQHNQQPLPNSSMTSAPVTNTQTASTSLNSPKLSFTFDPPSSARACNLNTPAQTLESPATAEEIPQHDRQPLPNSSMASAPVTNTQAATASTSLNSPKLSPPFDPPTACKLDTPATATPFQIETANAEQTCCWLSSVGADDDCLKIIRANKLRGKTLANCSVQKLCDLGLVFGDAEFIVGEVKALLSSRCQEQPSQIPLKKSTVGAEPLFCAEMRYKCFAFVVGNQ